MRGALTCLAVLIVAASTAIAAPAAGGDLEAASTPPPPDMHPVQAFGAATRWVVPTSEQVLAPVDLAADPSTDGYWRTDGLGRVEASGGAAQVGSTFGLDLAAPVVAIAPSPSGLGYWLAAADGGVFAFGDAAFLGSMGGTTLVAPVVDIVATPTGLGYWLVAADGGIFAFGDAAFLGSMGGTTLVAPVVAGGATTTGRGYWLAAADGGIFAFGDAAFLGSMGGTTLVAPIMGFAPTAGGTGYWLAAEDGGIFAFGSAPFLGSDVVRPGPRRTAFAASDDGAGYWISTLSIHGPVGMFDAVRTTPATSPFPTDGPAVLAAGTTVHTTGRVGGTTSGDPTVEIRDTDFGPRRFVLYDDLSPTPGVAPDPAVLPCDGGDEPASFPTPIQEPVPSGATPVGTRVHGVDHRVFADGCERMTIVFGTDDATGARVPAASVPGGVSFTGEGTSAFVYLPFIESQYPFVTVQSGLAGGAMELFTVVRLANPAGSREQAALVHLDRARRMEATFLEDPARLVIDVGAASSAPGAGQVARFDTMSGEVDDREPFMGITRIESVGGAVSVEGIGRPFEATADIELRTPDLVPGGGTPVTATFTGVIGGTVTADSAGVMTTDYIDAWGEYDFGIEGLSAGTYELFVGSYNMETLVPEGVYVTFTVS